MALAAGLLVPAAWAEDDRSQFEKDVAAIRAVGSKGAGAELAAEALPRLADAKPDQLPALLAAFRGAGPIARNLLAGTVQAVADGADPARLAGLLTESLKTDLDPEAAALAFDLLGRADPDAADRYLAESGLTSDAPAVRRAAVAAKLADAGDDPDKLGALLARTLDRDQVEEIAGKLGDAGEEVDLPRQFGFLTDWRLTGPFDHRGDTAFDRTLPPEETPGTIDADEEFPTDFPGAGPTVTWRPISTDDDFGLLDVAGNFENWKGSAVVLARTYEAPTAGPATFRIGTPNAFKLYLNGELLFARPEYHRGTKMDQYVVPATVNAGENVLLVKLLQNEQEQSWAQRYQIQFRVTDASGAAVREPGYYPRKPAE